MYFKAEVQVKPVREIQDKIRISFLTERVINYWNTLPWDAAGCPSTAAFKSRLSLF